MSKIRLSDGGKAVALLCGGIALYLFTPVLECCSGWLQSKINANLAHMQMDLESDGAEHQAAMQLIQPNDSNMTHAVGFQIQNEEASYEIQE